MARKWRDEVRPEELKAAGELLARLEQEGIGAQETIKAARSELLA